MPFKIQAHQSCLPTDTSNLRRRHPQTSLWISKQIHPSMGPTMSHPSPSTQFSNNRLKPSHTPIRTQQNQSPMELSPGSISLNDLFSDTNTNTNHPRHLRSFIGHPDALHEIGLTLSEVDEVLRRRASRLNDSPSPCPRKEKGQQNKSGDLLPNDGIHRHRESAGVSIRCRSCEAIASAGPFISPTLSTAALPSSLPFQQHGGVRAYGNIDVSPHHHQRASSSIPVHIISPSLSSSSTSSTSTTYHSPTSSYMPSSSSASSPASHHDFGPVGVLASLRGMASTIKGLEERIGELERRFRGLLEEVEYWKEEAEKVVVVDENMGWFMF